MVVEAQRLPVESLARAAEQLAGGLELRDALELLAAAAAEAAAADVAVVRLLDADTGMLVARAVAPGGSALAAELAGSRVAPDEIANGGLPWTTLRVAERARASGVLVVPARLGERVVGAIELLRAGGPFEDDERTLAELAAAQLALAVRTIPADGRTVGAQARARAIELAGEALAAGAGPGRPAAATGRGPAPPAGAPG